MITKLDNKYLVLNWENINKYLNNSEMRSLDMIIKKISVGRARDGKDEKNYVLVSNTMPMFNDTTQFVLDYINGEDYCPITENSIQKRITEAVTKATTKVVIQSKIGSGDNVADDKVVIKKVQKDGKNKS